MAFKVTIVGLGLVGSSIGLALRKSSAKIAVVGHDKNAEIARRAHKSGAVDKTEWNLIQACDGSDLVVLSTPLTEIRDTLAALANELMPGCVVTDTGRLKVPVLQWAQDTLPSTVHFVGGHPIVSMLSSSVPMQDEAEWAQPSAELLSGATYCLTPSAHTAPEALQRVADLTETVGAKPYYLDAAEHDGLIAALESLPLLSALTLQATVSSAPAQREILRLSGLEFAAATHVLGTDTQELADLLIHNADNTIRWLDTMQDKLTTLRQSLADGDLSILRQFVTATVEAREAWLRSQSTPEEMDYGDFGVGHMMFGDLLKTRRPRGQ